jgi:hyperosmotically inducible periplasmic protein
MTKPLLTGVLLGAAFVAAQPAVADDHIDKARARIERAVRRELVTLPFYSVFDNLAFRVEGATVTLWGKVSRPTLKTSAENVVKTIEGVENVSNHIEVLPLSANDNRLRLALYKSIYGHSVLQTLAIRALPPIHIIVENGNVTLEGIVADEMQRNIAGIQAKSVSGVFSVKNNLAVETKP